MAETEVSSLVESFTSTSLEESITASPGTVLQNTTGSSLRPSPFSCQKFVAPSAESLSSERDVSSLEELLDATSTEHKIIAIPGILPHKTVDGSSSFFLFSCEKRVAGVAESASVQNPQEPDTSLGAFLDSTSPEELITAIPQAEPCDPIDGSSGTFPFSCEKLVAGAAESASTSSKGSTTASPQPVLDNTTDGSPSSASSLGSKILKRSPQNFYRVFYGRMDSGGSFCMYPNLGGPFQSIDEADDAIDRYLDELRQRPMCKEQVKLSRVERLIHNCKYYLDGTPKKGPNSPKEDGNLYLVQALLHQYNEDHNLFGTHAHELKQSWDMNGFIMIIDGHCYGCRNNGSPDMKHPDNIGAYYGGHLDGYLPFGLVESSSDDDEEAKEERLRAKFKGLDDPKVWEKLLSITHKRKVEV